jgi:hypothetical protein
LPTVDPGREQWDREYKERQKAIGDEFNRKQQERYDLWLKRFV